MLTERVYYNHKPDLDNLAKIILDSLNGIAFDDDRQVVRLEVSKFYSDRPRAEVWLTEI
jgi:Holliday junction resolvase RusA-like endonuclease